MEGEEVTSEHLLEWTCCIYIRCWLLSYKESNTSDSFFLTTREIIRVTSQAWTRVIKPAGESHSVSRWCDTHVSSSPPPRSTTSVPHRWRRGPSTTPAFTVHPCHTLTHTKGQGLDTAVGSEMANTCPCLEESLVHPEGMLLSYPCGNGQIKEHGGDSEFCQREGKSGRSHRQGGFALGINKGAVSWKKVPSEAPGRRNTMIKGKGKQCFLLWLRRARGGTGRRPEAPLWGISHQRTVSSMSSPGLTPAT